mgnify:CR=1 FL=1
MGGNSSISSTFSFSSDELFANNKIISKGEKSSDSPLILNFISIDDGSFGSWAIDSGKDRTWEY